MNLVVIIFLLAYFLIILFRRYQLLVAYAAVIIIAALRLVPLQKLPGFINFNVLAIFITTSIITALLYEVGFIDYVATHTVNLIARRVKDEKKLRLIVMLTLVTLAGLISSFMENVATIMLLYPVGLEVARKLDIDPPSLLIGMSVVTNLEGSALLIGDSPSMITAMFMKMDFLDFFFLKAEHGKPSLFFAVQMGLVLGLLVLFFIFKGTVKRKRVKFDSEKFILEKRIESHIPLLIFGFYVLCLVASSFVPGKPDNYIVYLGGFFSLMSLLWTFLSFNRSREKKVDFLKHIDFQTFFFLIAIFILVGSLSYSGFIEKLAGWFTGTAKKFGKNPVLAGYVLIVFISMVVSAFVDNIPYTMAMLPVARDMALSLGVSPYLFVFGLLLGTTIGGNITPIGSLSNVTIMGVLRKNHYKHDFWTFIKIGLPFTLAALLVSSGFVYLVYR
ncbi:MAG: SLC13 family permease [Candidatus Hydrothermia bacterium]